MQTGRPAAGREVATQKQTPNFIMIRHAQGAVFSALRVLSFGRQKQTWDEGAAPVAPFFRLC